MAIPTRCYILLLHAVVLVHIQPCLPSPVLQVYREVQHPPVALQHSLLDIQDLHVGVGLQAYNSYLVKKSLYDYPEDGAGFPNPFKDLDACNSGVAKHGADKSFACDPDRNLEETDVTKLSLTIEEIVSSTPCQCPKSIGCSTKVPTGRFSIGIAVASNITGNSDNIYKLRTFSNSLKNKHWENMKRCDDFLVIALEVNSRTIYMNPDNPKVSNLIPDKCALDILKKTKKYFEDEDYYTGFSEILQYVKNALRGGECGMKPGELSVGQIVGIVFGVLAGVAFIAGLVVCCIGFRLEWDCVVNTCIGVMISMLMSCIQGLINALVYACVRAACDALGIEPCCECEPIDCVSGEDGGGVGAGLEY